MQRRLDQWDIRARLGDTYLHDTDSLSWIAIELQVVLPIHGSPQMKKQLRSSARESGGATAVEFALTMPLFLGLLVGCIQLGLALWTQFGLQYGSEAAARCASIDTTTCSTPDQTASYAASHALGLSLPSSAFTVSTPGCGNQISASYPYTFYTIVFGTPSVTLTARSCFPR